MNSTNNSDIHHDTTALCVSYAILSLSVIIANGVIIFVIARTEELHMNAMWMLFFRAIMDFAHGLYYIVFPVPSAFLDKFAYSESLIGLAFCMISLLNSQTVLNIALTVIERCIAVVKPFAYERLMTKRNFILAVLVSICVSIIRLLMIVFPDVDYYYNADMAICVVNFDTGLSVFASVGIMFITFIVIVITFFAIAIEMRRGRQRIQPFGENEAFTKFGFMVMTSVAVYCLCYTPMTIFVIWNMFDKVENIPVLFKQIGMNCLLSSSIWNVFIYTATYRPFREALVRCICPLYHRQQRRNDATA